MRIPSLPVVSVVFLLTASSALAQVYIISTGGGSSSPSYDDSVRYRDEHFLNMDGTAEIKVMPDLIDLSFEVMVRNRDFEAARKDQSERATKVLTAMRDAGIKETDLQASQVKIKSVYEGGYNEKDHTVISYYQISQDFGCTLHDPALVADVTGKVVAAGATGVSEAKLQTSQWRKYRDEAWHKAAVAAREKAELLASEIGKKIGKATAINAGGGSSYANTANSAATSASDQRDQSNFAPGLISVSASVTISFELKD